MKSDWAATALIALLVVAAFGNVVFAGKSLVPSENINPLDYRLNERNNGPGFVPAKAWAQRGLVSFPNYHDPAGALLQGEPSTEFLRRSLQRGEFPFWDPYVGGGMPSFATLIPSYLFPPSLLVIATGNHSAVHNAYILLLIVTAGALTYRLLREHGVTWTGAVAGGLAFAFSGAVIQTAPSFLGQPVALFSLPLLLSTRLLAQPSPRRAAHLAFGFAFVALATVPPILAQIFGLCSLYVLVTAFAVPRGKRLPAVSWFVTGAATALGVVALAYVPALLLIADSPHINAYYEHAAREVLQPQQIAQLLSPTIAGGALVYANPAVVGNTGLHLYYTGVVALLLAAIGMASGWASERRALVAIMTVAAGLSLAKVFGLAVIQWIEEVPLLRSLHFAAYFGILAAYAIAILAGLGVDGLVTGRARLRHVLLNALVLTAALMVVRRAATQAGVSYHPEGWRWIADFRLLVLFAALAGIGAVVAVRWPRRALLGAAIAVAVLAIEGVTNSVYPRQQRWDVWRHPPPYIGAITAQGTAGRVLPLPFYQANAQSVFRHPTLDTMTLFTSRRVFALYQRYFNPTAMQFLRETKLLPPEGVLDVANIEFVVAAADDAATVVEAIRRGYGTSFEDELVRVFRRPTPPRYSFRSSYRVGRPERILEALALPGDGHVWLEDRPSFPSSPPAIGDPRPRVEIFGLNEVQISVNAPRAGLLVCSESHMPGWTATVDGKPAELVPANYAFRAVEVPPGRHLVRMTYRAPGWRPGVLVSLLSLTAAVVAWRWPRLEPRPAV